MNKRDISPEELPGWFEFREKELERKNKRQLWLEAQREKAYSSYPEGVPVKTCTACHEPLVYDSMSYYEGWHFDSCE